MSQTTADTQTLATNKEQFLFKILDADLHVAQFSSNEKPSHLYEYYITLVSEADRIDATALIGKAAILDLRGPDDPIERQIYGLIARFERGKKGQHLPTYCFILVPSLDLFKQRKNNRIFQPMDIPSINLPTCEEVSEVRGHC